MKKLITILVVLLVITYLMATIVPVEPDEQRPGLGLAGAMAESPFISFEGQKQIYVETRTWYGIPHSVTTISWVQDGVLYVPCAWCEGKRWPRNVASNPNVRLKIDGALYERRAVKIEDAAERERLLAALDRSRLSEDLQVFRMELAP